MSFSFVWALSLTIMQNISIHVSTSVAIDVTEVTYLKNVYSTWVIVLRNPPLQAVHILGKHQARKMTYTRTPAQLKWRLVNVLILSRGKQTRGMHLTHFHYIKWPTSSETDYPCHCCVTVCQLDKWPVRYAVMYLLTLFAHLCLCSALHSLFFFSPISPSLTLCKVWAFLQQIESFLPLKGSMSVYMSVCS